MGERRSLCNYHSPADGQAGLLNPAAHHRLVTYIATVALPVRG